MSVEQQSKVALSFEDILKECWSALEASFSNVKSDDQSLQQIFHHDGNATGFMILLFNKQWQSDKSMGHGIFIERLRRNWSSHWSFPVVIDASLANVSNEIAKDWMSFMIVFKGDKALKQFINRGEFLLGQDCELLSTTNASRMSNHPDALFIYTLKESHGLGLVQHLSSFNGMRIRVDKWMNEKQYGNTFSMGKLENLKLNANGDYERIIKIVDEKFLATQMGSQQTIGERVKETLQNVTSATVEKVQGFAQNITNKFSSTESDELHRPSAEYHYTEPQLEKHIVEKEGQKTKLEQDKGKYTHTTENIYKTIIEPSGKPPAPLEDLTQSIAGNQGQMHGKGQQLGSQTKDTSQNYSKQEQTTDQ